MEVISANFSQPTRPLDPCWDIDLLEPDKPDDQTVVTTRRAISRVAMAATEVGGRFQREHIPYDPMAWMLAPRRMFDGRSAIDACLEPDHCLRTMLVHSLGLGLDPDPDALEMLAARDEDEDDEDDEIVWPDPAPASDNTDWPVGDFESPRLITATICYSDDHLMINAFHASFVSDPQQVLGYLEDRYGVDVLPAVRLRQGYYPADPMVIALVPFPIAEMILKIEAEEHPRPNGDFTVDIEHRIEN